MNFILLIILSSFAFSKNLSMKDLAIGSNVSDIQQKEVKPNTNLSKVDLGSDPLNMSPKKNYYPGNNTYRPMLSPNELAKREPSPESIGRYYPAN